MEKTPSQEANWVKQNELDEVFANAKSNATALYKKQNYLSLIFKIFRIILYFV